MLFWPSVLNIATGDWAYQGPADRERGSVRLGGSWKGAVEDNIFVVFKNGKWTVYVMFNAGGSGQGSECVSFTSHLTHLQSFSHK